MFRTNPKQRKKNVPDFSFGTFSFVPNRMELQRWEYLGKTMSSGGARGDKILKGGIIK
jgi:hypothetical protein